MSLTDLSADDVIRLLDLQPHPEGGHYVETFRDGGGITGPRGTSSAIYYLLREGEMSAWHRVTDASEVWHWHGGDAMELRVAPFGGGPATTIRLGPDLAAGEGPQGVVPSGDWQTTRLTGTWSLVGCTVAPAFQFDVWELSPEGWEPEGD
jgi:predicted cupin superfamily sugar epimerase